MARLVSGLVRRFSLKSFLFFSKQKSNSRMSSIENGSLEFPFLSDTSNDNYYFRTLMIIRGLPGSGKTLLAQEINKHFRESCQVISYAPPLPGHSNQFEKLANDISLSCKNGKEVIVVDHTNHQLEWLEQLFDIANGHQYTVLIIEPKTTWRHEKKLQCQGPPSVSEMEKMKEALSQPLLPLYYGWFLTHESGHHLKSLCNKFLKVMKELSEDKKHVEEFSLKSGEKPIDFETFHHEGPLHCTTKYCDYGSAEGASEYSEKKAVKDNYGAAFKLAIEALFITPRTLGARVKLTKDQLLLWPEDDEEQCNASLPFGSRAHITLGVAPGVQDVQTGIDLLEMVSMMQKGDKCEMVSEVSEGKLSYFRQDRWMLELNKKEEVKSVFSGYYSKRKQEEGKEGEEKKTENKPSRWKCGLL
ncbi:2',3'-cyclic-nucleotide 3'-phosphodiesterase [Erpetoichthys calabaricus]|uniref:2',3'-cyclic-nucleotide 3'-phosphodiesterase n=1 Tax=Erpetoichthys calabaricus TaxID=27687 RepID=A0A8C4TQ04_ERPCA|nr:2',3'-cyclic-nucleotide 3'-phosphodiesterase [Erpetoichthys calabaricus]